MLDLSELTDVQLVELAQGGDADAFGMLYERFAQTIFRFLYSHLDNRLDAEDMMEEIFLRVWRNLANYQEQGVPFLAYLFRVSRNALIDHYRKSGHTGENQVSLEVTQTSDDKPGPSDIATTNWEHQELRRVLGGLREEYRDVLSMRFLSELSPEETAQAMNKSVGAVRVLQHRALAALRKAIDGN